VGLLLGPPKAFPPPGGISALSSALLHRISAPGPDCLDGPPLNSLSLQSINVFLDWRTKNGSQCFGCCLMSAKYRGQSLPSVYGPVPVNTAKDAISHLGC